MKLFLAGEAGHSTCISKLKQFIGGSFKNKKIAYIPTAKNARYMGFWKSSETVKLVQTLSNHVEFIELESYYYTDIISKLSQADIIWVSGGLCGYLLYWIRRVGLDKALSQILKKGIIYVGSSAGSMICSKTTFWAEHYIGDEEPGASLIPGLGLIDFEIYPHYEEKLLPKIKKLWKHGDLYFLKDGEVITVVDNKVEVLGKKRVLTK